MAEIIKIKKGLDIPLAGRADNTMSYKIKASTVGIVPSDFPGYTWKLLVKPGDAVGKGSPLLQAKETPSLKLTSPSAGKVAEVRRGERRRILAVVVDCKSEGADPVCFEPHRSRDELIDLLCRSGLWAMMRQRPYDVVPRPEVMPRHRFITPFDSAPLAPGLL